MENKDIEIMLKSFKAKVLYQKFKNLIFLNAMQNCWHLMLSSRKE